MAIVDPDDPMVNGGVYDLSEVASTITRPTIFSLEGTTLRLCCYLLLLVEIEDE